jgi:uncharacterized protein
MGTEFLSLLFIGLLAGVMAGMFGIGGGIIMVPALITIMGFSIVQANGTSLAALMLPVGIFAVVTYYKNNLINIKVASFFAGGLLIGVYFGAKIALSINVVLLKQLYGFFLLWVCWRFFDFNVIKIQRRIERKINRFEKKSPIVVLMIFGITAGVLSGLFGVGGGLIMVPVMITFMNFEPKKAIGTSLAALLLPVALPGVIAYYNASQLNIKFALFMALGLVIGSIIGAKINVALPTKIIKRLYAFFLLIMGLDFIIGGF